MPNPTVNVLEQAEAHYGLPSQVVFCKQCVMSNQRPCSSVEFLHSKTHTHRVLHFDAEGVCDACRVAEQKERINWKEREEQLLQLLDQYRRTDGSYDCIVPGSGGKDSAYAAHVLKYKYGMHPLTVTWPPILYTDIGWKNFSSWIEIGGFNNITLRPNGRVHKLLTRLAIENLLHPFQTFILGQKNLAPKIALQTGVPLIFYGENEAEYGNPIADNTKSLRDKSYFTMHNLNEVYLAGCSVPELIETHQLSLNDLKPYLPAEVEALERSKIEVRYLGYYLRWTPQESYYYAVEHTGFEANPVRTEGTYSKYNSLDDMIDGLHYYTTHIKFGIGRATYDASQEIRNKHLTREEGVALVRRFDGEFPERYFRTVMDYIGMAPERFLELCDQFRSPHLWKPEQGEWMLRQPIDGTTEVAPSVVVITRDTPSYETPSPVIGGLEQQLALQPQEVRFCKRCVVSNQRPRIHFDDEGICSACRFTYEKYHVIDWKARERELEALLDSHRRTDGMWDVIVACSGGKDSSYVAHQLKTKYGMHPLTITYAPFRYTDIGYRNFINFVDSGFNNMLFYPNGQLHRKLARIAFEELGDAWQPFAYGQMCYAFHIAQRFGIKLVFYGENGEAEYGGDSKNNHLSHMPLEDWALLYFKGTMVDQLIEYGVKYKDYFSPLDVNESDLAFYRLPSITSLQGCGIQMHWYSYYHKWVPQENYYYSIEHTSFCANPERSEGTYSKYASLDDQMDGFHYYMAFIKFGISRATSDAAHEIRDGHITREEGVALVRRYDGEFPSKYFHEFLNYLGVDEAHFWRVVDAYRQPHLWEKTNGQWKLRHQVS